jgi:hypothetical protein
MGFFVLFWLPDAYVYGHVKRHEVLILNTWYSNLGVREFALWQFTFSFAGRFFCRSCDSPHILPNLFVHYFFGLVANLMHVWISGDRTA